VGPIYSPLTYSPLTYSLYLWKPIHLDVPIEHHASRIVGLQGERPFANATARLNGLILIQGSRVFGVIGRHFVIDLDDDVIPLHDHVVLEPLVVLGRGLEHLRDFIHASSLLRIGFERVIDLALVPCERPAFVLVLRVEIDPAVRVRPGHHFELQMEVFERLVGPDIEQVAAVTVGDNRPVLELNAVLVFARLLPTVERLAIEDRDKAVGIGLLFFSNGKR